MCLSRLWFCVDVLPLFACSFEPSLLEVNAPHWEETSPSVLSRVDREMVSDVSDDHACCGYREVDLERTSFPRTADAKVPVAVEDALTQDRPPMAPVALVLPGFGTFARLHCEPGRIPELIFKPRTIKT